MNLFNFLDRAAFNKNNMMYADFLNNTPNEVKINRMMTSKEIKEFDEYKKNNMNRLLNIVTEDENSQQNLNKNNKKEFKEISGIGVVQQIM